MVDLYQASSLKGSTNTVISSPLKPHTNAHTVCGRPTLSVFWKGRSTDLTRNQFTSDHFWANLSRTLRTMLYQMPGVNNGQMENSHKEYAMLSFLFYVRAVKQSTKDNWSIMSKFWRSQLDMPEKKPKFMQICVLFQITNVSSRKGIFLMSSFVNILVVKAPSRVVKFASMK